MISRLKLMGALKISLLVTGIAFALGTILNWWLRRRDRILPVNLDLAVMMVMVLHEAHAGLVIFSPVLSSKVLAAAIESNWQPGAIIEDNGDYEAASSVNFYTHRQIRILNGRCNNIWYGSTFPDAPQIFDNDASFEKLWQGDRIAFCWWMQRPKVAKAKPAEVMSNAGAINGECPQQDRAARRFSPPNWDVCWLNGAASCRLRMNGNFVLFRLRGGNNLLCGQCWPNLTVVDTKISPRHCTLLSK